MKKEQAIIGVLLILVVILGGISTYAMTRPAPSPSTVEKLIPQELIDLAKKEGEVIIYGGMDAPDVEKWVKPAFLKMFPWAKMTYIGMDSSEITTKVIAEYKAGKVTSDVEISNVAPSMVVVEAGAGESWMNPMLGYMAYPEGSYDPDGYWGPGVSLPIVVLYNTQQLKLEDVPTTVEAFADPKWQDKFVLDDPAALSGVSEIFAHMYPIWGEAKWTQVMTAIAANKPIIAPSSGDAYNMIATGQALLGIGLINDYIAGKSQGYPVGMAWLQPVTAHLGNTLLHKNAPHPNMAKLFLEWYVSTDGQLSVAATGRFPASPVVAAYTYPGVLPAGVNPVLVCGNNLDFYKNPDNWAAKFKAIFG